MAILWKRVEKVKESEATVIQIIMVKISWE